MIGRLAAMVPRVANVTDRTVAASTSASTARPLLDSGSAMVRMRLIQRR